MEARTCFLTGQPATIERQGERFVVTSEPCGTYEVSASLAVAEWERYGDRLYILAAVARQWAERGERLVLQAGNLDAVLASVVPPAGPLEQIDLLLQHVVRHSRQGGEEVPLPFARDFPLVFARDATAFRWLINKAIGLGYLEGTGRATGFDAALTLKGWQRVDELRRTGRDSEQAFVAMWFDASMTEAWAHGIRPALEDTGWKPIRIDTVAHNEKIDDRIVAEIRRSGLLVADFTGHRGGVYFEAGLAMGLGLPVIWTCRVDHLNGLHFDTRQYNHIVWHEATDLRERLRLRIEATNLARASRRREGVQAGPG
ncbi:MAG: hypothetical protein KatS3mg043_2138 [Rhodothermaceae bacterium]|nr:MAG: hypothetical protein KatS3mg043_2138 [Rhodothermaceae bacterium]